jgi:hypothetical protein
MIYRYKATIPQYKNFIRVYEVRANSTLYSFHLFLQNDLSFSPDQQVFFRTFDRTGNQVRECGLFDTGHGSMDQIRLDTLHKKGEKRLHYVFDIFKERYLLLEFESIEDEMFRKTYPRTIMEKGGAPDQFREERNDFDLSFEEVDSVDTDNI